MNLVPFLPELQRNDLKNKIYNNRNFFCPNIKCYDNVDCKTCTMHIYNVYNFFFYKWCIQRKLFKNCLSLFNLFIVQSFRVPNICSTVFYFNGCTTDNMPERDVTKWKTFTQTAFIIIWLITFARNQNLLLMTSMIMSVSPLFNLFYFTRVILKAHKSTIVFKRTYRINSFQYLFNFLINQFIFYYLRDFFFQILKWTLAICSM